MASFKSEDAGKYLCPMAFTAFTSLGRCDCQGDKCAWWVEETKTYVEGLYSNNPLIVTNELTGLGHCGAIRT